MLKQLGSLIAMPVYHYMNTKFVIITCLILNSAALLLFTVGNNFYILCLSRVLVGVFQVFFCIYFPVWVDLYADESRKTIWLTTLLIGVPLGVITGYSLTAVLILYVNWKWTFYGQAFAMIPLALFFLMTPAKYMVY
jgi:predicted MFS family arabinose efflux permease